MSTSSETRIGHVHLKVSDLDKSIQFYRDIIGLHVTQRYGDQAAFLAAGDYHHGLYHTAFVYPDRAELAAVLKNIIKAGIQIDGAADHGVSEAIYLRDPDHNGVEIYRDRDHMDWPREADGTIKMVNSALDLQALLDEIA